MVSQIQADIRAGKHDGDPDDVDTEEEIEGGSKSTPGGKGRADIFFDDGETIWIWEVKGSTTEMPPLVDQAKTASKEADDYIAAYKLANPGLDRDIKPGWRLDEPITTKYTNFAGQMEDLIIDNTQGGGGIKYRTVPIYIGPTLPPASPQELSALEKLALGLAGLPFVLTPMGGADAIVPPYFTQPPPTA